MFRQTRVIEYGMPDISKSSWCKEGLVFQVVNGLDKLKEVFSKEDENYCYYSQLQLNDVPIVQGYFPVCPTCYGMLATGYGIENVKCDELASIRETLNQNYFGIQAAFSSLKPLLKLLSDGFYMLADVALSPTDGHRFFYNVPNKMTEYSAVCDQFYNHDFLTVTDGFPAFMYPTQSSKSIDDQRVEEYKRALEQGAEIRGLAYYEKGFICALLDGHHKAIAAAQLGQKLKCLTIIRVDGCTFKDSKLPLQNKRVKSFSFAGAQIDTKAKLTYEKLFPQHGKCTPIKIERYELTDNRFAPMEKLAVKMYHSVEHISSLDAAGINDSEITDEKINCWISLADEDSRVKLKYLLEYRALSDYESAYHIAEAIIRSRCRNMPYMEAWRTLLQKKDEHTEQMAIAYLVEHTPQDECWDIVTSYWDSNI